MLSSSDRSESLAESELRVAVDGSSVRKVVTASLDNRGVAVAASNKALYQGRQDLVICG